MTYQVVAPLLDACVLGIIAQSAGEITHIRPGGSVRYYRCADHAVMGQVNRYSRI